MNTPDKSVRVRMPDPKKYRFDWFSFRTPKGVKWQLVAVSSGAGERKRLVEKAEKIAKENNWKII